MPNLQVLIERGEVCCCLREKTLFYQTGEETPDVPEGPFWCGQTQSVVGPDGELVGAERCRPGRSCCEVV